MTRFWPVRAALLLGVLATLDAASSQAQWMQTNGPRGGSISSLPAVPLGAGGTPLLCGPPPPREHRRPRRELVASHQWPAGPQRIDAPRRAGWLGWLRHSVRDQ